MWCDKNLADPGHDDRGCGGDAAVSRVAASTPPTTPSNGGPVATNDLLPENNDVTNCIGTAEPANCGSRARADGHTYLVFLALTVGLAFIGWRIARGVRARDEAHKPAASHVRASA
jgi:hypothetical protein